MGSKTGYLLITTARIACPHCEMRLEVGGRVDLDPRILEHLGYSINCSGCHKNYRVPQIPRHLGVGEPKLDHRKNIIKSHARRLAKEKQ